MYYRNTNSRRRSLRETILNSYTFVVFNYLLCVNVLQMLMREPLANLMIVIYSRTFAISLPSGFNLTIIERYSYLRTFATLLDLWVLEPPDS